jgi:carbonic anhydrase
LPQITYPNTPGFLHHLGDVVKFVPDTKDGTYVYNDGQYQLIQWHIHTPSEHRIGERDFVAEIHCIFMFIMYSCSSARQ